MADASAKSATDDRQVPEDCRVDDPQAIRALLQKLANKHSILSLNEPGQDALLVTAVIQVDASTGQLHLDPSRNDSANAKAMRLSRSYCSGQLDRIGVSFQLGPLRMDTLDGRPAFGASIPSSMLHLQRRQSYRVDVPLSASLDCTITLPASPGAPPRQIAVRVSDLSTGGLGIRVPDGMEEYFAQGQPLLDVHLRLPSLGDLLLNADIVRLTQQSVGDRHWFHAGCRFVKNPASTGVLIQRCVTQLERDLILRLRGVR